MTPTDGSEAYWIRGTDVIFVKSGLEGALIGRKDSMPLEVQEPVEQVIARIHLAERGKMMVLQDGTLAPVA